MASIQPGETARLIASDKVEGIGVYDAGNKRLGTIHHVMVNQLTGSVEYAVLQLSGPIGMGSDYYPLPWKALDYDRYQGRYIFALSGATLRNAPHFAPYEDPTFDNSYGTEVYGAYGLTYGCDDGPRLQAAQPTEG